MVATPRWRGDCGRGHVHGRRVAVQSANAWGADFVPGPTYAHRGVRTDPAPRGDGTLGAESEAGEHSVNPG